MAKTDLLLPFIEKARNELQVRDPVVLAAKSGISYRRTEGGKGEFRFAFWGHGYQITCPDFIAREEGEKPCSPWMQSLFLHYLLTADGTPLAHRWISLREVEGGRFYFQAFQGYSGDKLIKYFGNDICGFRQAAERAGGERRDLGDAAYAFWALPRVPLVVIYWLGDEEFPPTAQVLFDASADHYLPVDVLAVLGGQLCDMIIRGAEESGGG